MVEKTESESYGEEKEVENAQKVREKQKKEEDWEEYCESERKILELKI